MSFQFNWPDFDPIFHAEAKQQLETALNKEKKSKHIADHIFVKELNMGSKPPELEILEICELSTDYFRGIFKLTYCGDAFIELKTKIQANPLHSPSSPHHERPYYQPLLPSYSRPSMVTAAQSLVIPMLLRISDVRLNGIIVLSVSATKGITLVFKNDALESLLVSSTFDIVPSIKSFLQQQIESQLRTFLQDTFPLVVHEYSLRHINDQHQQQQQTRARLSSIQQQQQQNRKHNVTASCGSSVNSDTTTTIPELTSSFSDRYSDTSSECISYDDGDNNFFADTPPPVNEFSQLKSEDKIYLSPIMTTSQNPTSLNRKNVSPPSIATTNISDYDTHTLSADHHQHRYDSSFTSLPPSNTGSFIQRRHSCVYQQENFDDDDDSNVTNTSDQRIHYLDDKTPVTPTLFINQPILITTTDDRGSHGLIQQMADISVSSHTLAIDTDNRNNISRNTFLIHKTTMMADNTIGNRHHQRKKIPKRRIIKWNA
ncbi:hypothetical protein BCR42DRAFT_408909 [Absidia repens]|uniref:Mitochondrial distribution and morphology protein 34 n=1 Tax=Absidia repens TaxID=90262 RepID=A0A1X2IQF0_9FUNG|nr:hypothetical protein BCR42DRAFT_408909 [Absidia repens]